MTNARDWYANRVRQQQSAPPQSYPQRPQPQQYAPQQYQQPPPPQDPSQIQVTIENVYEAASLWRGGQAAKTEHQNCPSCGSGQFFSRAGLSRMPAPAPHCYNCGFNGLFDQGQPSSWGVA